MTAIDQLIHNGKISFLSTDKCDELEFIRIMLNSIHYMCLSCYDKHYAVLRDIKYEGLVLNKIRTDILHESCMSVYKLWLNKYNPKFKEMHYSFIKKAILSVNNYAKERSLKIRDLNPDEICIYYSYNNVVIVHNESYIIKIIK